MVGCRAVTDREPSIPAFPLEHMCLFRKMLDRSPDGSVLFDDSGRVVDYKLRQEDPKRASVQALHSLNYRVIAAGDSYNDTTMLGEADVGFLIHAPQNVIDEFPQFKPVNTLEELKAAFVKASERELSL